MANIKEWMTKSVLIRAGEIDKLKNRIDQLETIIKENNCSFCFNGLSDEHSSCENCGISWCPGDHYNNIVLIDDNMYCRRCRFEVCISCNICGGVVCKQCVLLVHASRTSYCNTCEKNKPWSYMENIKNIKNIKNIEDSGATQAQSEFSAFKKCLRIACLRIAYNFLYLQNVKFDSPFIVR